jgi:hypothetical protein
MARRRNKPASPAEIAARRAERAAMDAEAARLELQPDVQVTRDPRTREITNARRLDVFALLLSRKALDKDAHDAFRDHEETVHVAAGWATPERRPDHIRASTEGAPGQNVSQGMIEASRMVKATFDRLSPPEAALLDALMTLGASGLTQWRSTVQRLTGENNDHGQASRIRSLGENLIYARRAAMKSLVNAANDDCKPALTEYANSATHR